MSLTADDTGYWANRFGLAIAPLFEKEVISSPGSHSVLLDGAYGTFAMSVSNEELWRKPDPANWIWSSGIPHHVTVTPTKVAVLRWDRPTEFRLFERESIERNLDRFYGFLTDDRLRSNRGVVDHLLGFFRRLRSLGHAAGVPDVRATDLFTASLARLIAGPDVAASPWDYGLAEDAGELLTRIDQRGLEAANQEVEQGSGGLSWLRLYPSLAVRHAGGQLFQEAHFELLRGATDFDLFGLVGASEVATMNRGGTHFTPATLARSLIESALDNLSKPLDQCHELTLCDPACGSGAFLHEALRALRRARYKGRLRLVGYDISPAAIAMARFAVAVSLRDWAPEGGVELDLRVGDSLGELGMPTADVIIMNPPFIGFAAQTPSQREQ
ncbi:MAG TPA: N-6 DNA methylase, partial [Kaistia sp.]|nr:N-6 DNA methylase [Kaistia sp.]